MKKLLFALLLGSISWSSQGQSAADSMLNFILRNKGRAALYMLKNDYEVAKLNEDKMMPLAGISNVIVATEFAKQAAYNVFGFNAWIPLSELYKYYLPNTDDGAHKSWIHYETRIGHVRNDSVKLIDIARGMVMYNSQANSEYLMELLGFNNLKNDIRMYGIKQHSLLYPLPSSLFIYQNPKGLQEDKLLKEIQALPEEDYYKAVFSIHRELNNDSGYLQKFRPQDLSLKMQKAWSARLPASTAKEYAKVFRLINSRIILNEKSYAVLGKLLESMMESPANKALYKHAGSIGGNTVSVLTRGIYATQKDGTKVELTYFFNDLTTKENYKVQSWTADFESRIMKDEKFRTRFAEQIMGKK